MKAAARALFGALALTWIGCPSDQLEAPIATGYELRRASFFQATANAEPVNTYSEVMRLNEGIAPDESKIRFDLDRLTNREDTSDFNLPAILWMLYEHDDSGLLSGELKADARSVLLKHKFWPDERLNETEWLPEPDHPDTRDYVPTTDSMVYLTENHYILYASSAYLAGQLFPDEVFEASDETGAEKMETFRPRVLQWLELRFKAGFSEWLSNVYYDEDISALVALVEFVEDEEIRTLAAMVLDLIFIDMALNQYDGAFGSTHGRTSEHKMSGRRDSTRSTFKLVFDLNEFNPGNSSSSTLALSTSYLPPYLAWDIAHDTARDEMENRQRMSIKLEEAEIWGLDTSRFEDGMMIMTMEAYTHVLTIGLWVEMLDAYGWWAHDDYRIFKEFEGILRGPEFREAIAIEYEKDITRNMRPEVDIYTYRKPHYMLSTAQDWRKGYGGDQQSIWQATLGIDAVAFTTHPASDSWEGPTPRAWTGYGTMPRAIQIKNVVISLYDRDEAAELYQPNQPSHTHAFLPRDKFDESSKEGGWFFARKGDGYLALWSSDPDSEWEPEDPEHADVGVHEIIADNSNAEGEPTGKQVWIAELGSVDEYADYQAFKDAIAQAPLSVDAEALTVQYESPSQGRLVMAWDGPLLQDGAPVDVDDYPRYGNPYSETPFRDDVISFEFKDGKYQDRRLVLDYANRTREVSHELY